MSKLERAEQEILRFFGNRNLNHGCRWAEILSEFVPKSGKDLIAHPRAGFVQQFAFRECSLIAFQICGKIFIALIFVCLFIQTDFVVCHEIAVFIAQFPAPLMNILIIRNFKLQRWHGVPPPGNELPRYFGLSLRDRKSPVRTAHNSPEIHFRDNDGMVFSYYVGAIPCDCPVSSPVIALFSKDKHRGLSLRIMSENI